MTEETTEMGQEASPPIVAGPLPIWPILRDAVLVPWERRGHFGRLMVIPLICTFLFEVAWVYWFGDYDSSLQENYKLFLLLNFPVGLLLVVYAVACHRSILMGEYTVPRLGIGRWTVRESRFLIWSILIVVIVIGAIFSSGVGLLLLSMFGFVISSIANKFSDVSFEVLDYLTSPIFYLWWLLLPYVFGRCSLILPATAIDLRPTLSSVWTQSTGNGLRVAFVVCIIPWTCSYVLNEYSIGIGGEEGVVLMFIRNFLLFLVATFEITVLSITYKELSWWNGQRLEKG